MSYSKLRPVALKQWKPLLEENENISSYIKESKDPNYKLGWMSEYCFIHSKQDQMALNESFNYSSNASLGNTNGMGSVRPASAPNGTYSFYNGGTGSGDKFPSTLPIAMQVAARTVGFDIVSVIPMPGPTGILMYMDYVYAGGKTGSSEQPTMIRLSANNINSTDYVINQLYWGVSDAPTLGTNTGDANTFADGLKAVEMIFVGYSFIDGYPIFRIGNTYKYASNALVLDETITLKQIFDTSAIIAADNAGKPNPGVKPANLTLDPLTYMATSAKPQLVTALEDHIQGYAGAGNNDQDPWVASWTDGAQNFDAMSRGTGENTYYRNMNITAFTRMVEAKTVQVSATVTTEQIQDLNKQWGMDVISMVEGALINEISQSINKHILSRAFALGWSNNSKVAKAERYTLNFTTVKTNTTATTSPAFVNQLGFTETITIPPYQNFGDFENMTTMQRRVKSKIFAAGNVVMQRGRRGRPNFVVCNVQVASALQDASGYTIAPMTNTLTQSANLYPAGTLSDMTVYVDPNMKHTDTRILVGRKGGDDEPGLKFMPYLMAETIQTIAEATMSPKIVVKSRYALVEAGHHPETQYYTIYADFGAAGII